MKQHKKIYGVKKFIRKAEIYLCLAVVLALVLCGCSIGYEDYSAAGTVMDTVFTASFRARGYENGKNLWGKLENCGINLENMELSRQADTSEIAAINASAGSQEGYPLSEEMERYLDTCIEISKETDGAFDISLGALIKLWNIDEAAVNPDSFVVPSQEEIDAALSCCGYEKIVIIDHRIYIPKGMILDLGAVGKGIYLAVAKEILETDASYGVVAAGGSILTFGHKADGNPWRVGIVDPFDTSGTAAVLSLEGTYYVSTSGDYERYVEYEGKIYHHILDPHTGYPADTGIRAVSAALPEGTENLSVKADNQYGDSADANDLDSDASVYDVNGLLSDAITTAVFVMGEEKGIELAEKYGAEILIIRSDGSTYMSDGFAKMAD